MKLTKFALGALASTLPVFFLSGCLNTNMSLPVGGSSYLHRAYELLQQGKYVDAAKDAAQAATDPKSRALAQSISACCMCYDGKFDEASDAAREAVQLLPQAANTHAALAQALLGLKSLDEGEAEARKALKLPDAIDLPSNRIQQHLVLAEILALETNAKAWADSANEFAAVVAADPSAMGSALYGDRAKVLGEFANVLYRLGRYKDAEAQLNEAIRLNPQEISFYVLLASVESSQGKLKESLAALDKLDELKPGDITVQVLRAKLLLRSGKFADAEAAANKIIAGKSDSGAAYAILADALRQENRMKEAESAAVKSVRYSPDRPESYLSFVRILIARKEWMDASIQLQMAKNLSSQDQELNTEIAALQEQVVPNMPKIKIKLPPGMKQGQ